MSLARVDRQQAVTADGLPGQAELEVWVDAVLTRHAVADDSELTVRLVDLEESRTLNRDYRGKDSPTNVLSFPFESPPGISLPLLGDLVICHPVVVAEACAQDKRLEDHYAHLVVHGTLHLLGHDHLQDDEAEAMEQLEREILADFSIADPYAAPNPEGGERHSDTEDT